MYKNLAPGTIGIQTNLRESLRLATIGGFEGVDLPVEEVLELVEKYSPDYVKGMYDSFNIKIGGWGLPVKIYSEEEKFKEGIENLKKFCRIADEIGAKRIISGIKPFSDEMDYQENFKWHRERIKKIMEVTEGFKIGFEFIGTPSLRKGHKFQFVHNLEQMLELISPFENAGILLDSWHWFVSGGKIEDIKNLDKEKIVYVHINDAPDDDIENLEDTVRNLPGETGVIDLSGFLGALKEIGYDGPVTPEPFNQRVNKMPDEMSVRLVGGYLTKLFEKI